MSSAPRFTRALLAVLSIGVLAACGAARPSATAAQTSPSAADVSAASQAALTLFVRVDANTNMWVPCPSADAFIACPLSQPVKDRLGALVESNYFYSGPGGHCGGDFISNSTNGLQEAPAVVSAVANPDGSVTVVIERANVQIPELTAVMAKAGDRWVATDLSSGSGPNASIFAAKPNC